ncbi:MAG: molybdopterin-dependent oxidoreductase [Sphingomonadales bacterium]|nr:molybdopterin-dependent oxidoreductase [Sphingomonadales bacterium]
MADNANPNIDEATALPKKKKGVKRRAFLIGGLAVVGGGVFALQYGDYAAARDALAMTKGGKSGSFTGWLKIGEDDRITVYSPHIDMGTGNGTALAQMVADELDADWDSISVEHAPADNAFANAWLAKGFVKDIAGVSLPGSIASLMSRNMVNQITGGSSAVRFTGQIGMRTLGATAREALVTEAAERLKVPAGELTTAKGVVTHAKSGRSLRYGELAIAASQRSLSSEPKLKAPKDFVLIGKPMPRFDIPAKVDGSAIYGIDVQLPDMRVAAVMAAPVRGGKLESVDPAPAMAVKGVEKVVQMDNAVAVVAKGYWPALKGLQALSPKFSDGGHAAVSSAAIAAEQDRLVKEAALSVDASGGKLVEAGYRAPYLHHMMMEPFAMTAHRKGDSLEVWGGMQDPLATRKALADAAGLDFDNVTLNTTLLGGGFGRKLPGAGTDIVPQVVKLAMESPWPGKLIWPREEEVKQGTYRPASTIAFKAALGADGKVSAWSAAFAQAAGGESGMKLIYDIPSVEVEHVEHSTNIITAAWRSVEASHHLAVGSRAARVLDAAAKASGWGTPLPTGRGRGIAVVESFGTVCAHVIEASVKEDGNPKVHKVWAAVDCGQVVNSNNAEAQVAGGIVMGLSAAIGEEITIDKGAVVQSSFPDYPIMQIADAPEIFVEFLQSEAPIGGLGEPGLPPAAPALANALFAATGKRIRNMPFRTQAVA